MGILSCLHISDLHIGETPDAGVEDFYTQICDDIRTNQQKIDYVLFTGDIFWGRADNKDHLLTAAVGFFRKLLERINRLSLSNRPLTEREFVFVPGNHDLLREEEDQYALYKKFLLAFYPEEMYEELYKNDYMYTLRIDPDRKIAFVGFNSCTVKRTLSKRDEEWIKRLSLDGAGIDKDKEEEVKKLLVAQKEEIDDYGEISVDQLNTVFDTLADAVGDLNEYRIVAFFHHHIYPFPEVFTRHGDSSMIRNFAVVIEQFLSRKVSIILHGHKHTPIARPIVNNKFYKDPRKMIHVFSAGSVGSDRGSKCFQVVEVHSLNDRTDVQATKYHYLGMEFQRTEVVTFPPVEKELKATSDIIEILKVRNSALHDQYCNDLFLRDSESRKYQLDRIIEYISDTITAFKEVRGSLEKRSDIIYILLLGIHYRTLVHDGSTQNRKILKQIKELLRNVFLDDSFTDDVCDMLHTIRGTLYLKKYKAIQENKEYHAFRKQLAYVVAVTHLLDLYLTLGYYGEVYFKKEGIKSKVNFKLEEDTFKENLPNTLLRIKGEEDRRMAVVSFKCLNPTVHKAAVLIVKDFEERITKIEDAFKEIGLKVYYVRPVVTPSGYDLENYNFEAYIPKLLPLLTGEHLYKQKEVFIRELVQNSLDAILLREKINPEVDFDKNIYISFGEKEEGNKKIKYITIRDYGIGMDQYKIERYFTSIGRSFYTSEDYEELLQEKNANYQAVSNFGIGFLSVFMVSSTVKILTKSYDEEKEAIEMDIPNYEGCFFVKKNKGEIPVGTEITIFEGEGRTFNPRNVNKYIKENLLNIGLNISLNGEVIERYALFNRLIQKEDFLFVPINEEGVVDVGYEEMKRTIDRYQYGVMVVLKGEGNAFFFNSGIKVSTRRKGLKIGVDDKFFDEYTPFDLYYFFPSSFIQLDVSRERILSFKNKGKEINKAVNLILTRQAVEYVRVLKQNKSLEKIVIIDDLYNLLFKLEGDFLLRNELYWFGMTFHEKITFFVVKEIDCISPDVFYFSRSEFRNKNVLKEFLLKLYAEKLEIKESQVKVGNNSHRTVNFYFLNNLNKELKSNSLVDITNSLDIKSPFSYASVKLVKEFILYVIDVSFLGETRLRRDIYNSHYIPYRNICHTISFEEAETN